jgi:riboflavin-specific deaminase-like protein
MMAAMAPALAICRDAVAFAWRDNRLVSTSHADPDALVAWDTRTGWEVLLAPSDPRHGLIDLWVPLCSARPSSPMAVGHLGQSVDGFIATPSGDSQFVTGRQNILHLHRLRALCSAVIVGAGTVASDNPMLTTRHVDGPNPLRVIFDPSRRLTADYRLFTDDAAPTLYACGKVHLGRDESHVGQATVVPLGSDVPVLAAAELMMLLRARGCFRLFVEGGGVTVSAFLEAGLLDRLQIAIAPVIIGNGRPSVRLPAREALRDCARPAYRVFRMGGDVLFDCNLRIPAPSGDIESTIVRVI